ncbi:MAG: hypothetical protein JXB19_00465 [Bacteroidales bacterium]|nr:hypothetical protein [Bacteroidales bacterium]
MDKQTLNDLLERFYKGETDIREEKMLHYHLTFSGKDIQDYETDRLLARLTESLKEKQNTVSDIEGSIAAYIDKRMTNTFIKRFRKSINRYAVAAAIAILIGMTGFLFYLRYGESPSDTYSDPQLAYLETEKTLLFVSEKLNTGLEPLSNINKINSGTRPLKSFETIERNLEMVGFFSFINQSSSLKK